MLYDGLGKSVRDFVGALELTDRSLSGKVLFAVGFVVKKRVSEATGVEPVWQNAESA